MSRFWPWALPFPPQASTATLSLAAAPPRLTRGPTLTMLRLRSTCTAHTLVSTSASTTGTPPAMAALCRATGAGTSGGGSRNCKLSESATSVMRSACATSGASDSTLGCPPRMATTSAPLVVRSSQRSAVHPSGRLAGVRAHGEELTSCSGREVEGGGSVEDKGRWVSGTASQWAR